MNNEKGMTLIELLATLVISTIVLGVSFALLASVVQTSKNSSQKYTDSTSINDTMNTIAEQISASSQVVYYAANQELRFKMGSVYKSLYFDSGLNELTIYHFSDDGDSTDDAAQFTDSSINLVNNSTLYTSPQILSKIVSSANYYLKDGTVLTSTPLTDGELIKINLAFTTLFNKINGGTSSQTVTRSTTLKLLADTTSK